MQAKVAITISVTIVSNSLIDYSVVNYFHKNKERHAVNNDPFLINDIHVCSYIYYICFQTMQ